MAQRRTIAVLSPMHGGSYFGAILTGVQHATVGAGGRVLAIQTLDARLEYAPRDDADFTSQVAWDHVDAFIIIINAVSPSYLQAIRRSGKPVVMISRETPGFRCPVVMPDNTSGTREAVEHLMSHGHQRIGFAGNLDQADIQERYAAFRATLADNAMPFDEDWFFPTADNTEAGARTAAAAFAAAASSVTALVVATDHNAIAFMAALTAAGKNLPDDMAIVGFDNLDVCTTTSPTLSSISPSLHRIGATAAEMVFAELAGERVSAGRHVVPASLVPRESCGCGSAGIAAPGTPPRDRASGPAGRRTRFVQVLQHGLPESPAPDVAAEIAPLGATLADAFEAAAADLPGPSAAELGRTVASLHRLGAERGSFAAIVTASLALVRELLDEPAHADAATVQRIDACLIGLTLAAHDVPMRERYVANRQLRTSLSDEYELSADLLRSEAGTPESLEWLALMQVTGGCVALHTDNGAEDSDADAMRIAGVFTRQHRETTAVGTPYSVQSFPPREFVEMADDSDDVVFVLPVRSRETDWGILTVVAPVQRSSVSRRETYYQWAAMLTAALDHQRILTSLRNQRSDLSAAYGRERGLVESIRASEERYALAARAANDGLWDWDLSSGTIFYSTRWKEMLGYDEGEIGDGADEWLGRVHPDDLAELTAILGAGSEAFECEHRMRARDGDYRWVLCRALAVGGADGAGRLVGSLTDVTGRKQLEDRLRHEALYDGLSGLPNRNLFVDRLEMAIAKCKRYHQQAFAVLFIDLDGFKNVNDSLGHAAGDAVLAHVAQRLRKHLRTTDTAARIGGDEFAVLLTDLPALETVNRVVERIQRSLAEPHDVGDQRVVVTASIGIATSETGYDGPEEVLRHADLAMYQAKTRERGTSAAYDESMHSTAVERLKTETALRIAIDEHQLELHYQPIVALGTHRIEAMEALIRWRHPQRGLIGPGEFLHVAEQTGLMVAIGKMVVRQACRQVAAWHAAGIMPADARISINMSNVEFWHTGFHDYLVDCVDAAGAQPQWLNVEITEGVIMNNPDAARQLLLALRKRGFDLHIDDFGTGYSSLGALHRFPIQALKMDRSFVSRIQHDRKSRELVRTIIMMGRNLGMDVIAEGIETDEQETILAELGCRLGQGFWFSQPLDAEQAGSLLGAARERAAASAAGVPS